MWNFNNVANASQKYKQYSFTVTPICKQTIFGINNTSRVKKSGTRILKKIFKSCHDFFFANLKLSHRGKVLCGS